MKSFVALALWALVILKIEVIAATVTSVKWNKRLQDFEPIPGVPSYEDEKQRRILQSRQEETDNFNGTPLHIIYYEEPGFFEFYDNDTKATGICGDIWTALSKMLNFTLVLTRVETNSTELGSTKDVFKKIVEYARHNKTDIIPKLQVVKELRGIINFTPILWLNRKRIFAHAHWKGNHSWMFDTFSIEVWALVLTFIVTLSIASIVTQRVLIRNRILKLRDRSYIAHLFYTFGSLCNQGTASDNAVSGFKILTFTINIFSWLTLVAYNSCLINGMTREVVDKPFANLRTLLENTQLQILVLAGSLGHDKFFGPQAYGILRRIVKMNRISVESNIYDLYSKVCSHPDKYVLFEEEDAVAIRSKTHCRLLPIDLPRFPNPVACGMSGRVKNKKSLEIGIMKLHEFGIINGIRNQYMVSKIEESTVKQTTSLFIDMNRVSLIFVILGIGILASIIICVIESIVFALKKNKNI